MLYFSVPVFILYGVATHQEWFNGKMQTHLTLQYAKTSSQEKTRYSGYFKGLFFTGYGIFYCKHHL